MQVRVWVGVCAIAADDLGTIIQYYRVLHDDNAVFLHIRCDNTSHETQSAATQQCFATETRLK